MSAPLIEMSSGSEVIIFPPMPANSRMLQESVAAEVSCRRCDWRVQRSRVSCRVSLQACCRTASDQEFGLEWLEYEFHAELVAFVFWLVLLPRDGIVCIEEISGIQARWCLSKSARLSPRQKFSIRIINPARFSRVNR